MGRKIKIIRKEISARTAYGDFGSQKALTIYLDGLLSQEMCLAIMLLYRGLTESLEIKVDGFTILFRLGVEKHSYCTSLEEKERRAEVLIAPNAAGLIVNFLLRYYRDGIGEAEHIDVDFRISKEEEFTVTFEVDKFRVASPEEMGELLRD